MSEEDGFDAGEFTKISQRGVEIRTVAQAGIFIGPALNQSVDIAMSGDEPVGPERNSALVQAALNHSAGGSKMVQRVMAI